MSTDIIASRYETRIEAISRNRFKAYLLIAFLPIYATLVMVHFTDNVIAMVTNDPSLKNYSTESTPEVIPETVRTKVGESTVEKADGSVIVTPIFFDVPTGKSTIVWCYQDVELSLFENLIYLALFVGANVLFVVMARWYFEGNTGYQMLAVDKGCRLFSATCILHNDPKEENEGFVRYLGKSSDVVGAFRFSIPKIRCGENLEREILVSEGAIVAVRSCSIMGRERGFGIVNEFSVVKSWRGGAEILVRYKMGLG